MLSKTTYQFSVSQNQTIQPPRQIVVIDPHIDDYQILAAGVIPGVELLILNPDRDGIEQITAYLTSLPAGEQGSRGSVGSVGSVGRKIAYPSSPSSPSSHPSPSPRPPVQKSPRPPLPPSLHLISHGSPGRIHLGNTTLELNNLEKYRPQLEKWGIAHLYIYGCKVAAGDAGAEFLQKLHQITQAQIYANPKPTGNAVLGGTWELQPIQSPPFQGGLGGFFNSPPSPRLPVSWSPRPPVPHTLPFRQEVLETYSGLFPASFPIIESFQNSTTADPNWILGGIDSNANAGGGDAYLTSGVTDPFGNTDPVGDGWLRLTSPENSPDSATDTGYAIYNQAFSSSNGIVVSFDYAAYGKTTANGGDGFSFFLLDGSVASPTTGTTAGGVGYANKIATTVAPGTGDGLTGGYVGIGFDVFGSFTRQDIGTDDNDPNEWTPLSPGNPNINNPPATAKNTVALRGNAGSGYPLLEKQQISDVAVGATIDGVTRTNARAVQITIVNDLIKVEMDLGGGLQEIFTYNSLSTNNGSPPAEYKMGFSAATAGANNYHEIRHVEIQKPADLTITKDDGLTSVNPGNSITYNITVSNNDYNDVSNVMINDALTGISGISWSVLSTIGTASVSDNGTTGQFNPTVNLNKSSAITFQVSGTVDGTAALTSAAAITLPTTGEKDVNLADNSATDTTNISPVFTSPATTTGTQGVAYSYNITTTDPDSPTTVITAPTLPGWLTFTDNGNGTATLTGTPGAGDVGYQNVLLRVDDSIGTNDQSFTIFINANAPTLTGDSSLPAIDEDNTTPGGETITNLFGGMFQDPDSGDSLSGIAVVGNNADPTTEGTWQYSADGINWFDIGTVGDDSTALALSVATKLRFVPVADYNGIPRSLVVRALDRGYGAGFTAGATRVNVNTTINGGSSSISSTTSNLNTTVNSINDPPSFSHLGDQTLPTWTNLPQTVPNWAIPLAFGPADESTQTVANFLVTIASGDTLFTTLPDVANDGTLSYSPTGEPGTATISVQLQDSGGTADGGNDTSAPATFIITVPPPIVNLEVIPHIGSEVTSSIITINANVAGPVFGDQTLDITLSGTADNTDFTTPIPAQIIIPDGASTGSVTVTVAEDNIDEGEETATFTISKPSAGIQLGSTTTATVTIAEDDIEMITVTPIGLTTTEAGGGADFTVVLNLQPTADVMINLTSDRPGEGTVNLPTLTFTSANWNQPQTVTVTGVDDNIDDGDINYNIVTAPAISTDPNYNGFDAADVAVTNIDDDTAGINVSASTINVTEGGANGTYELVLTSAPTAPVTINFTTDSQLHPIDPINFDATNWNVPQTVPVQAVDDGNVERLHFSTIAHNAVSTDPSYNGIVPAPVTANIADNDTGGVSLLQPVGTADVIEGFGSDVYKLVLTSPPVADVTIALSTDGKITTDMATVTFTPSNWNLPQAVTVTAVDDSQITGNQLSDITHTVTSADTAYHNIAVGIIPVNISDNDNQGEIFTLAQPGIIGLTKQDDIVTGSPANDIIYDWDGNDIIDGGDGDDKLYAQSGDDGVNGGGGNDVIFGGLGNDHATGLGGNDILYGGEGSDRLHGSDGNDQLFGDSGNDFLSGGAGVDTLTGGSGRDAFALGNGTGGMTVDAADVIVDFVKGEDIFYLSGNLTFSQLVISQGLDSLANDAIIQDGLSGEFLAVVQGVAAANLAAEDFL
ncbi:DUF4347 domain-containing protein [[Phormidium] sp. ETS-05]|uniref:DUF4347 domain-containing protein n=1 Tax=[Phormidium] sp. ETS-05 TaxID=222819 RepID=UPI0018EF1AB5|nr:DUF4347 domain-containing protein [[Phormidium] sp. ETS-05]